MVGKRILNRLGKRSHVVTVGRHPNADIVMDLADADVVSAEGRTADTLIHCAASFGGGIEGSIENELVNAVGCLRVARLAAGMGCRHLIYISSVSAFFENLRGNSYGLSKRHGQENLELVCGELGINLTSLLVTQLYDDLGEARAHQPGFYHIIDCAREGSAFSFHGHDDPLRNLLFVEDLVSVIERVVDRRVNGSFGVVHPTSYHFSDIISLAYEVFGRKLEIIRCLDKPNIPAVWYPPADSALYDRISYHPATDLRAGIAKIRDRMP